MVSVGWDVGQFAGCGGGFLFVKTACICFVDAEINSNPEGSSPLLDSRPTLATSRPPTC